MRNQKDFKFSRAWLLQHNTQNLTKQQSYNTLWRPDTAAVGLLRTRAFRQKSWDSLNIHGSKKWFHSLLSYAWHCSENLRRVTDNNCHSSPFIFIYQSHMTWKSTSLPTELSKWQQQDWLCPVFSASRFQEQSMYHTCNQNLESTVPQVETWAFFPQFHLLLQCYYT